MVLEMSRSVRHPDTGIYQLRKRVPQHLIPLAGKSVVKISLKTRDRQEAIISHARMLADIETRCQQLSAGVITLLQNQAVAMSGVINQSTVAAIHNADPAQEPWHRLTSCSRARQCASCCGSTQTFHFALEF